MLYIILETRRGEKLLSCKYEYRYVNITNVITILFGLVVIYVFKCYIISGHVIMMRWKAGCWHQGAGVGAGVLLCVCVTRWPLADGGGVLAVAASISLHNVV